MKTTQKKKRSGRRSRREVLKSAGALVSASALAGLSAPPCHASSDETIRLALVGCGGRGTGAVLDAFSTKGGRVLLYAMADLFPERISSSLKRISSRHPKSVDVPPERQFLGFDAYKKAIDCLRPSDVVILTTHAAFRPLHFEYAVKKGVNVFAEKSFAVDAPAVRRWLRAAELSEKKGLKVGVGFMWRHSLARQEVIKRIKDGAIGELRMIRIYRMHGPVHCPKRPPQMNEIEFQIRHANSFTWVSGGFFVDWHCHNVDVACWTKGAWPVRAQAMGGRCYREAGNQFDHYAVEYTFPDGTKLFAYSRHMLGCHQIYADYAHGTKGSAVIMASLHDPRPCIYRDQAMKRENLVWAFGRRDPNPYHVEWQVLLDAIRNNKPHNEARRAGEADIAALMGRAAAHTGKLVTWDDVVKSEFQFVEDIDHMSFEREAPIHEGPDGIYPAPQPGITKEL